MSLFIYSKTGFCYQGVVVRRISHLYNRSTRIISEFIYTHFLIALETIQLQVTFVYTTVASIHV